MRRFSAMGYNPTRQSGDVLRSAPFSFASPKFSDLLRGLVQPVLISREPDHLNGGKPLRRIGGRIAKWRQLSSIHQNLNVMLCETKKFGSCRDVKTCRQISCRPGRHRRLCHVVSRSHLGIGILQAIPSAPPRPPALRAGGHGRACRVPSISQAPQSFGVLSVRPQRIVSLAFYVQHREINHVKPDRYTMPAPTETVIS